jgi:hypothetical protein
MFGLFSGLTAAWLTLLVRRRAIAHRIHWLMGVLVLLKALTLLTQVGGAGGWVGALGADEGSTNLAGRKPSGAGARGRGRLTKPLPPQAIMTRHVEATGEPEGWNLAYYVTTTARGLLFFTVVVLIGAGWSYMKVEGRGWGEGGVGGGGLGARSREPHGACGRRPLNTSSDRARAAAWPARAPLPRRLQPFLDDNTRKTLMVVVPLQVGPRAGAGRPVSACPLLSSAARCCSAPQLTAGRPRGPAAPALNPLDLSKPPPTPLPPPPPSRQVFANIALVFVDEESPAMRDWWGPRGGGGRKQGPHRPPAAGRRRACHRGCSRLA